MGRKDSNHQNWNFLFWLTWRGFSFFKGKLLVFSSFPEFPSPREAAGPPSGGFEKSGPGLMVRSVMKIRQDAARGGLLPKSKITDNSERWLENPSEEVRGVAREYLEEFAGAGDPFSHAHLAGRPIPPPA